MLAGYLVAFFFLAAIVIGIVTQIAGAEQKTATRRHVDEVANEHWKERPALHAFYQSVGSSPDMAARWLAFRNEHPLDWETRDDFPRP